MAFPFRAIAARESGSKNCRGPAKFWLAGSSAGSSKHNKPAHSMLTQRPGDPVEQSGIYEVVHHQEHRASHEVVMISGETFPDCDQCKDNVRFRLVRTAPYIFQDEDFEDGPA